MRYTALPWFLLFFLCFCLKSLFFICFLSGKCGAGFCQHIRTEHHEYGEGARLPASRWAGRPVGELSLHRLFTVCGRPGVPSPQSHPGRYRQHLGTPHLSSVFSKAFFVPDSHEMTWKPAFLVWLKSHISFQENKQFHIINKQKQQFSPWPPIRGGGGVAKGECMFLFL